MRKVDNRLGFDEATLVANERWIITEYFKGQILLFIANIIQFITAMQWVHSQTLNTQD
jgi:hypothetical protein